jgi:hypothetical protein
MALGHLDIIHIPGVDHESPEDEDPNRDSIPIAQGTSLDHMVSDPIAIAISGMTPLAHGLSLTHWPGEIRT